MKEHRPSNGDGIIDEAWPRDALMKAARKGLEVIIELSTTFPGIHDTTLPGISEPITGKVRSFGLYDFIIPSPEGDYYIAYSAVYSLEVSDQVPDNRMDKTTQGANDENTTRTRGF